MSQQSIEAVSYSVTVRSGPHGPTDDQSSTPSSVHGRHSRAGGGGGGVAGRDESDEMTTTSSGGSGASSADEIGSVIGWYRGGRAGESGSTSDQGCRGGVAGRRAAGGLGNGVESEEMTMISGGGGGGGGAGGAVITALARAAASRPVQFIAERGSRRGIARGRMFISRR